MKVNILDARNRLSQLIKAAQAGEDVVIANRGRPVARLSAIVAEDLEEAPVGSSARILACLDQHIHRRQIRAARPRLSRPYRPSATHGTDLR